MKKCKRCGFDCGGTCGPLCTGCGNEACAPVHDDRGYPWHQECLEAALEEEESKS